MQKVSQYCHVFFASDVLCDAVWNFFITKGVQLAKKVTSFRFSFAKSCGFRFGFSFTKLTAVLVFLVRFFALCVV